MIGRSVTERSRDVQLVIDATGFPHGDGIGPENTFRHLDTEVLARVFALNAIGPALVMKHALPLLPRDGRAVCVALHPGHIESRHSAPFGSGGQATSSSAEAADRLLAVIDGLEASDTGGFFDQAGAPIPSWARRTRLTAPSRAHRAPRASLRAPGARRR